MLLTPFVGELFCFLKPKPPFSDLSFLLDLRPVPLLLDSFLPCLLTLVKGVSESFLGERSLGVLTVALNSGDVARREDLASLVV